MTRRIGPRKAAMLKGEATYYGPPCPFCRCPERSTQEAKCTACFGYGPPVRSNLDDWDAVAEARNVRYEDIGT